MKRQFILHPFLFTAYSVIGIYSRNAVEIPIGWVLRPLVAALFIVSVIFALFYLWTKNARRAGLMTTLGLFWFVFGHVVHVLQDIPQINRIPGYAFLAFIFWSAPLFLLGSQWAWSRIKNGRLITVFLNATSIFVLLLPAYTTARYGWQALTNTKITSAQGSLDETLFLQPPSNKPDIYWIVLDGYGRADYLKEAYGYDNLDFLNFLTGKGFYVASESSPNYPQTELSLASALNMQYLDSFAADLQNTDNRNPLTNIIQHSILRQALSEAGYTFIALPSAAMFAQVRDADIYPSMTIGNMNEFEGLLLSTTILDIPIELLHWNIPIPSYDLHRRYIFQALESLKAIPELPGQKFVFAHILAPHPPFVVDADGNPTQADRPYNMGDAGGFQGTDSEYETGYISEIQFLNQEMRQVVTAILEKSETPPIIIIQGDHGPGDHYNTLELDKSCLRERYSILNVYYFPGQNYAALYPGITPVNSFRVILNTYFGTNLKRLEDRNYYAAWFTPYQLIDVTDDVNNICIIP